MKPNNKELEIIWDELTDIFMNYTTMNERVKTRLYSIGFIVRDNKSHCKIDMPNGKMMIISKTPSDKHVGRQILRTIRKLYSQ